MLPQGAGADGIEGQAVAGKVRALLHATAARHALHMSRHRLRVSFARVLVACNDWVAEHASPTDGARP